MQASKHTSLTSRMVAMLCLLFGSNYLKLPKHNLWWLAILWLYQLLPDFSYYCVLMQGKICTPPILHTTLRQKWGRGIFLNIQWLLISLMHRPPRFLVIVTSGIENQQWLLLISGKTATLLNMYYGKSAALVLILSWKVSKQLALLLVTRDDPA